MWGRLNYNKNRARDLAGNPCGRHSHKKAEVVLEQWKKVAFSIKLGFSVLEECQLNSDGQKKKFVEEVEHFLQEE